MAESKTENQKDLTCKNCKSFYCHSAVDRLFYCRNTHGLKHINVVEDSPSCSYFERKDGGNYDL